MNTTRYCPECARPIDALEGGRWERFCPNCGAPLPDEVPERWVNVARVASLAEAGFLADELSGEGIDARIYQADEFSALAGGAKASYYLQTLPDDSQAAAAHIRRHLAEAEPAGPADGGWPWNEDHAASEPVLWRPVALMVLAGVASFIVGQKFAADRDAARQPRASLPGAVKAIGRPLLTEPVPGLARHRLYYSNRQQVWYLDTDRNGDGRFESRRRFPASGAAW